MCDHHAEAHDCGHYKVCVVWISEEDSESYFPPHITEMCPGVWEGSYCSHSSSLKEIELSKILKISDFSSKRRFWDCDQKEDVLFSGYSTEYISF